MSLEGLTLEKGPHSTALLGNLQTDANVSCLLGTHLLNSVLNHAIWMTLVHPLGTLCVSEGDWMREQKLWSADLLLYVLPRLTFMLPWQRWVVVAACLAHRVKMMDYVVLYRSLLNPALSIIPIVSVIK